MSKAFDRLIGNFTIEKHEKFVRVVALFALISMILCAAVFLTGALYKLELKIRVDGAIAGFDETGCPIIKLRVDNRFFENVAEGQTVLAKDKKIGKELGVFQISEIYTPEFEKSAFFTVTALPVKPFTIQKEIRASDPVAAEIIYNKVRIMQVLLSKKI